MGWNYLPIPKLQPLHRWSLGMDRLFHPTHYNGCNYLSMLGFKLNHVSKRGPRRMIHGMVNQKYAFFSQVWLYPIHNECYTYSHSQSKCPLSCITSFYLFIWESEDTRCVFYGYSCTEHVWVTCSYLIGKVYSSIPFVLLAISYCQNEQPNLIVSIVT